MRRGLRLNTAPDVSSLDVHYARCSLPVGAVIFLPEISMSFACFSLLEVEATPRIESLVKLDCSLVAFDQVKKEEGLGWPLPD